MEREAEAESNGRYVLNASASFFDATSMNSINVESLRYLPTSSSSTEVVDLEYDVSLNDSGDDEVDECSGSSAVFCCTGSSENAIVDSTISWDNGRSCRQTFSMGRCVTPPLTALFSRSCASKVGLRHQSIPHDHCGSLHFIGLSSMTSDRTMVDHGASTELGKLKHFEHLQNTGQNRFVQRCLLQSARRRSYLSLMKKRESQFKLSFDECRLEHPRGNKVNVRVGGDVSISAKDYSRSRSCPVGVLHADLPCNSHFGKERLFSCPAPTNNTLSVLNTTCIKSPTQWRLSEEFCQYRLAVQNAKNGRYGLSIKEILAGHCCLDDEDEQKDTTDTCGC